MTRRIEPSSDSSTISPLSSEAVWLPRAMDVVIRSLLVVGPSDVSLVGGAAAVMDAGGSHGLPEALLHPFLVAVPRGSSDSGRRNREE